MDVITYSLRGSEPTSDRYYATVGAFAAEVLDEGHSRLAGLVDRYRAWRGPRAPGPEECLVELLALGTFFRVYSDDAAVLAALPRYVLTQLADWRRQAGALKPGIDWLRGMLATLFLEPEDRPPAEPGAEQLEALLHWLEATGEFRYEAARLWRWHTFLNGLGHREAERLLGEVVAYARWFESRSEAVLGDYTPNVERFLAEEWPAHRWREDLIACGRQRVEYHLNMVGAEILNQAWEPAFDSRPRKAVLMPGCMRKRPEGECQAEPGPLGARCTGCTPGCRVDTVRRLGERHGFGAFVVPHESSALTGAAPADLGVVGIACVTGLLAGGWKAQALGIPAQCVLLDYCGCRQHWDEDGFPTDINPGRLVELVK